MWAWSSQQDEVYLLPKSLDETVTKLHIPHSAQSSPSLLWNKQFLEVSRLKAFPGLKDMKVDKSSLKWIPLSFPFVTA